MITSDTIAAIATPAGRGGVGIVRVSGSQAGQIAEALCGKRPTPRQATLATFCDANQQPIDQGLALYFVAPHSFTGQDVLELQGHGGLVVMDLLLARVIELGARMARPGEFTERAFLNDKIDLTQAEAVADLIDASSVEAARSAVRALQGAFSEQIEPLVAQLIDLRVFVEGAIDFPEEEIDFISEGDVAQRIDNLLAAIAAIEKTAQQGALLREGIELVIVGPPNVGKSSLLNCLTGQESAIVTDIAGTTRDVIREYILLDGIPIHLLDTAGLRESGDVVEAEGMRRAKQALGKAHIVLLVLDGSIHGPDDVAALCEQFFDEQPEPLLVVFNKSDLQAHQGALCVSAKTELGIDSLRSAIKTLAGCESPPEGVFIARQRHLQALVAAKGCFLDVQQQLTTLRAAELIAEDLHRAQQHLGEITGEFTQDQLLGEIFSRFCIGK